MIIYKTTNLVNNKIYVGKDSRNRSTYLGSGLRLRRAVKKYGRDNFKKDILEICNNDDWQQREIHWIKTLNSRNSDISYNIAEGGEGTGHGKKHSNETKIKMGLTRMGLRLKPFSEKHKQRIRESHLGVRRSEETKRKISLGMKGNIISEETKTKISNTHKGMKHSDETKHKMSMIRKGRVTWIKGKHHSEETKRKISTTNEKVFLGQNNPMFGRKHSEETKIKMRLARIDRKFSEETRLKMRLAHVGQNNPMFGKTHSEETIAKMKISRQQRSNHESNCEHAEEIAVNFQDQEKGS